MSLRGAIGKSVFGLVLLLVMTFALGWWLTPNWLPLLAQKLADRAGVKLIALELERPGWENWKISALRAEVAGFGISATDAEISWQCCSQFTGSLIAEIQRVIIVQRDQPPVASQAESPLVLTAVLNRLAQQMPFARLMISKLFIEKPSPSSSPAGTAKAKTGTGKTLIPVELQLIKQSGYLKAALQLNPGSCSPVAAPLGSRIAPLRARVEWQMPDHVSVHISQAASVTKLQGKLDGQNVWQWSGQYNLQLPVLAEFFKYVSREPVVTYIAALKQLDIAGQLTASVPDNVGDGAWQVSIENKTDARVESPLAIALTGTQTLSISGETLPQRISINSAYLNGVLKDDMGWQHLPKRWQISLQELFACEFGRAMTPDEQTVAPDEPAAFNHCLRRIAIGLRSLAEKAQPAALEASAKIDLSTTPRLPVDLQAVAQFNISGYPEQVRLRGLFNLNLDGLALTATAPVHLDWQSLDLAPQMSSSGGLVLEQLLLTGITAQKPKLSTMLAGRAVLDLADQPLKVEVKTRLEATASEVHLTDASLESMGLHFPLELKLLPAKNKGWLSVRGGGKLLNTDILQAWLPEDLSDYLITPGLLQSQSFMHFSYAGGLAVNGRTRFSLDDWQLQSEFRKIKGMSLNGDLQYNNTRLRLVNPLQLRIKSASLGIPLQDVGLDMEGKITLEDEIKCQFLLTRAQLSTLGGQARTLQPVQISCPVTDIDVLVEIKDFDLGKLVAIESDKVIARGRISGTVPIRYEQGSLVIDKGSVAAQEPGSIKLTDPQYWRGLAGENESLQVTVGILENLEFDTLMVEIAMDSEGVLRLNTRFRGRNPDFHHEKYKGQVVELNLNIENNILQLLRSATLPAKIEERLQKVFEQPR